MDICIYLCKTAKGKENNFCQTDNLNNCDDSALQDIDGTNLDYTIVIYISG